MPPKKGKLPPEAYKFVQAMGLDLNGLEPEAEDVWRKLNDWQQSDPAQYEAFVGQQMESMKEDEALKAAGGGSKDTSSAKRSLRPDAGFCVQSETYSGDGVKIREYDDTKQRSKGKLIFVNVCESKAIECPRDGSGKPVDDLRSQADGLSMPLLVGPVRDFQTNSLVVDVIVHPSVVKMSLNSKHFKKQVIDLAFEWVMNESETGLRMYLDGWEDVSPSGENKRAYKGGRGEDGGVPVLFVVDIEAEEAKRKKHEEGSTKQSRGNATLDPTKPEKEVLNSTSSLLSHVHNDRSQQEPEIGKLNLNANESKNANSNSSLVEEVGGKKKEDEGGLFSKIGQNIKKQDKSKEKKDSASVFSGKGAETETRSAVKVSPKKMPTKKESDEIESMLGQFDEEFSSGRSEWASNEEQSNNMISDLAKMLGNGPGNSTDMAAMFANAVTDPSSDISKLISSEDAAKMKERIVGHPSLAAPVCASPTVAPSPPKPLRSSATTIASSSGRMVSLKNPHEFTVVNGLPYFENVTPSFSEGDGTYLTVVVKVMKSHWEIFDPLRIDLQVSASEIKIVADCEEISKKAALTVAIPTGLVVNHQLDAERASAGYKKKKGVLTVKVFCKNVN